MGDMWLPYPPAELIARGRCPDCGCHPRTGHKDEKPALYDKLRAKGYSKTKAARISNAVAAGTIDHHRGRRKSVGARLTKRRKR